MSGAAQPAESFPTRRTYIDFYSSCRSPVKRELQPFPETLDAQSRFRVFKVATTLPGVSTAGEGAAGFNVRGGKTDQNLILLDRAVVYNPTHFFGLFPALNPFAVAALNVYKGSIPVKYGGRLSAVFDMETKAPNNQSVKGEASLGPITANLMLEIPLQKDSASILIGGRSAHANWVLCIKTGKRGQ